MTQEISPRNETFLGFVVKHFIETGNSIGSSVLISKYGINWSPATVRKGLNSLMEDGFLAQSHISSGRYPTEKGMNYYVENILRTGEYLKTGLAFLESTYEKVDGTLDHVISVTSHMLSDFTKLAGLAMLPQRNALRVKSAELLRMSDKECLIVLVFEGCLTEKTFIRLAKPISEAQVQRIGTYLNRLILGLTIDQVRKVVLEKIKRTTTEYNEVLERVLRISSELFEKERKAGLFVEGKLSVIESLSYTNYALYKTIIKILEDQELLSNLLKSVVEDGRSKVFIGSDKGMPEGFSLVAAPYSKGQSYGSLGVFGPTRMNYSKIIPFVNYTAEMVTRRVNRGAKQ